MDHYSGFAGGLLGNDRLRLQITARCWQRLSATRQASTISEYELQPIMRTLGGVVIWEMDDPEFSELLGPPPWKGGIGYGVGPIDADVPLHMSDEMMLLKNASALPAEVKADADVRSCIC